MPFFGNKRDSSEDYDQQFHSTGANSHTASRFSRRSGSVGSHSSGNSLDRTDTGSRRSGSLLTKFRSNSVDPAFSNALANDPAIKAARQKVVNAEHAESEADRVLDMARNAVKEARQHVKDLEAAAFQDIKRAQAKHNEAKNIRKDAGRLGRHGA